MENLIPEKPTITSEQIKQRTKEIFEDEGIEIPEDFDLMITGIPLLKNYAAKLKKNAGKWNKFLTDIKNSNLIG